MTKGRLLASVSVPVRRVAAFRRSSRERQQALVSAANPNGQKKHSMSTYGQRVCSHETAQRTGSHKQTRHRNDDGRTRTRARERRAGEEAIPGRFVTAT